MLAAIGFLHGPTPIDVSFVYVASVLYSVPLLAGGLLQAELPVR